MKTILKKPIAMHYRVIITILISLFFSEFGSGQSFSEKRTFRKSFRVNKEITLEVNNKYGSIHISPCNSDSVTIEAEVEAVASNQERIEKMLQGININISESSFLIRAQTDFTQNISMLFESFKGMTNKLIPYESKIQINYFITAPEYLNIRVINKYGDVYMENNTGTFSIDLSNGSFKANTLKKSGGIDLNFCDATINKISEGYIDASFSELVIGESDNLTISSLSSRFDLKKAGTLDTKSRRDKFFIGSVNSIRGNSYFTDYKIEKVEDEINLVSKYGKITADFIEKSIGMVTINCGYTDVYLTFDPSLSYNVDIRHINTFLILPEKNASIEKKTISEDKKEFMTIGTIGRNPGNIKVRIDATRGNIYIK